MASGLPRPRRVTRPALGPAVLLASALACALGAAGCSRTDPAAAPPATARPATSATVAPAPPTSTGTTVPAVPGTTEAPIPIKPRPPSGPATTMVPQEDALLGAVHGSWSGPGGTITFHDDGTVDAAVHDCPPVAGGPQFGFTVACPVTTASGRVSVGDFTLRLLPADGSPLFERSVFVDAGGRLHLGTGPVLTMSPDRRAVIVVPGQATTIEVDGDTCRRVDAAGGAVPEPCTWAVVDGQKTLTVAGTTYLYDDQVGVITTPAVFFNSFTRS